MLCKSVDFKGLTPFKSSPLMNTDNTDLNNAKTSTADNRGWTRMNPDTCNSRWVIFRFVAVSFTFGVDFTTLVWHSRPRLCGPFPLRSFLPLVVIEFEFLGVPLQPLWLNLLFFRSRRMSRD